MLVSYVAPSMDAAIADDVKDLKFRNNMETPAYIEAVLSEGNLTFNIYGKDVRPEGRTVEYISESLETVESDETRYVATEDPIGTMYTQDNGHNGLKAQLWKVVCGDVLEERGSVCKDQRGDRVPGQGSDQRSDCGDHGR